MKYRKKPVVIEAFLYDGEFTGRDSNPGVPGWAMNALTTGTIWFKGGDLFISTMEGVHHASVGDYIIKGVAGEIYPCKPDIFAKTYEAADADTPIILGDNAYREIVVAGPDNEILAVITSGNIIEHEGYQVILNQTGL